MANKGMNPKALQYIMGHKNIRITLDYYAHATSASAKRDIFKTIFKNPVIKPFGAMLQGFYIYLLITTT